MLKKYILGSINLYTLIISIILYIIALLTIKMYSTSLSILIIISSIVSLIISLYCYISKNILIYNIGTIITLLLNTIFIFNIITLNSNYDYLSNIFTNKYNYDTYSIYVKKKNTSFNNIEKLNYKKIGTLNNNSENICAFIKKEVNAECISYTSISSISKALENGEIQSFIITESAYNNLNTREKIKNETRSIYSTKIKNIRF